MRTSDDHSLMMETGTQYQIQLENNTDQSYHFAVYQKFPDSSGLKSLAWQVRRLAKKHSSPTTSTITWTLDYGIAISQWDEDGKSYSGLLHQDASLGMEYVAYMDSDGDPDIDPHPQSTTEKGQVTFFNGNKPPKPQTLPLGFTVHGDIIAVQNTKPGESAQFHVHPTYFVACYRNIKKGNLVDSDVMLKPVKVSFEDTTVMKVTAYEHDGVYKLGLGKV